MLPQQSRVLQLVQLPARAASAPILANGRARIPGLIYTGWFYGSGYCRPSYQLFAAKRRSTTA